MIRIIIRTDDANMAAHVQGACIETEFRTFDIEVPEIEAFMNQPRTEKWQYVSRTIVGVEVLAAAQEGESK